MPSQWSKRLPGEFRRQKKQTMAFKVKSLGTHAGGRKHKRAPGPNNMGLLMGPGTTRLGAAWGMTNLRPEPRYAEPVVSELQRQEGQVVASLVELQGVTAFEARQAVGQIVGKAFRGCQKAQKWLSLNIPALFAKHQNRFTWNPAAAVAVSTQAACN